MALTKLNARSASALDATILTGNLPALNASALTTINATNISSGTLNSARYTAGGITHAQLWNMNTAFQGQGNPIANNWSATWNNDVGDHNSLGSNSVTESSGIFTFGATGIWKVEFTIGFANNTGADENIFAEILTTLNNSTYNYSSRAGASLSLASENSSATANALYDITDTTNQKVQFKGGVVDNTTYIYGHGDYIHTYAIFIRLGDT